MGEIKEIEEMFWFKEFLVLDLCNLGRFLSSVLENLESDLPLKRWS